MSTWPGSQIDPDRLTEDIVARFSDRLRVFAARRLHDREAAADAVQETLKRVLEALRENRVRDLDALPGYVFETARHVCMRAVRDGQRTARAYAALTELLSASTPSPCEEQLGAILSAERRQFARLALAKLDAGDRQLIRLTLMEGMTAEAIAATLGTTANNVRVRRHRILRNIAASIVTGSPSREPKE